MEEKELTLEVEAPDDLPLVDVDAKRLRWAVINLVRNAWQYTPSGGSVTLRLHQHDGQVIFDVIDTGTGISPENQQYLFGRFSRVRKTEPSPDEADVRGLGIGLYVTKAIIEAHDGEIQVISEEKAGSTFSVILPALEEREGTSESK
jgi:signal transduction histidine kinase